jgi:hypothetical protein
VTLAAARPLPAPLSIVVPFMLAAIPLADTTTVVIARLRRAINPAQAGKDHLSHRLVSRGVGSGRAVCALVAASFTVAVLGASVGRGIVPPSLGIVFGSFTVGLVLAVAVPARPYEGSTVPVRDWRQSAALGAVVTAVAMIAGAVLVGGVAYSAGKGTGRLSSQAAQLRIQTVATNVGHTSGGGSDTLMLSGMAGLGTVLFIVLRRRHRSEAARLTAGGARMPCPEGGPPNIPGTDRAAGSGRQSGLVGHLPRRRTA